MNPAILPMFVAIPLVAAGLLILVGDRLRVQLTIMAAVLLSMVGLSIRLIFFFTDNDAIAHGVGNWPFGIAIPLVADMLSALVITVTGLLTLVTSVFAYATGVARSRFFAPLVLILTAGVNGAFLTADLFNLFVFIEVMLVPSYALFLLTSSGAASLKQVAGARMYLMVNLLTSTIFLAGVGLVYGAAGTVNLAQLASMGESDGSVAMAFAICLFALGIKAAVVPVHGWLGRAYPATSPAITALFSGLHTKVAVYAIYRIYAVVFNGDTRYLLIGAIILGATMFIGVMAAVGETFSRSILAFHMVSQNGYILFGVVLFTQLGLAAGIFYLMHHMFVKAGLFLSVGAVEVKYGTGKLGRLKELSAREPLLAGAFFVVALSMAGIPPFSGFVAKLTLIMAAIELEHFVAVGVMILVSLITFLSMLKIWSGVFWGSGDGEETDKPVDTDTYSPRSIRGIALVAPAVTLAVVTISIGVGAEFVFNLAEIAAEDLLNPGRYVQAVLGS